MKKVLFWIVGIVKANPVSIFLLAWVLLVILAFWVGVKYHNNDDYDMVNMVKGIYPYNESSFLFYSSNILGCIYKILYKYLGLIEWYVVLYVLAITFSFVTFFNVLFKVHKGFANYFLIIGVIFFYYFGIKIITEVSFTYAAGVLSSVGYLILAIDNRGHKKSFRVSLILPYMLILIGSLYRFDMMILILFVFIGVNTSLMVIKVVMYKYNVISDSFKYYIKNIISVAIPSIMCLAIHSISISSYKADQRRFVEYQTYRSRILDNEIIQRASNRAEIYKNSGWSKLEEKVFFNWMAPDMEPFSLDALKTVSETADVSKNMRWENLKGKVRNIIADNIYLNEIIILAIFVSMLLLFFEFSLHNVCVIICSIIVVLIVIVILSFMFKVPPTRILLPLLIMMILMNWVLISWEKISYPIRASKTGVVIFSCFILIICIQNWRYTRREDKLNHSRIADLDNRLLNSGIKYFISIPDNYPAYYHDIGFWSEDNLARPNVYHTGPFFNHPRNNGYSQLWEKRSFVDSLKKSRVVFYFSSKNYEQMTNVGMLMDTMILKHYGLRCTREVDSLENVGYLLSIRGIE